MASLHLLYPVSALESRHGDDSKSLCSLSVNMFGLIKFITSFTQQSIRFRTGCTLFFYCVENTIFCIQSIYDQFSIIFIEQISCGSLLTMYCMVSVYLMHLRLQTQTNRKTTILMFIVKGPAYPQINSVGPPDQASTCDQT